MKAVVWKSKWNRLLGTCPDSELATTLGVNSAVVCYQRARQQKGCANREDGRSKRRVWKTAWDQLLGKMTDSALGQQLGVSSQTVRLQRLHAGVLACGQDRTLRGTPDGALTSGHAGATAAKLGVSLAVVRRELARRGLTPPPSPPRFQLDEAKHAAVAGILKKLGDNHGVGAEIARTLGISRQRAHQIIKTVRALGTT